MSILHKVKITFTDQNGILLDTYDTEGWDMEANNATKFIGGEVREVLDRIVARFGDDYKPWMYAKEVMEYTGAEVMSYPDGIALVRKAESIAGFHEARFTPVLKTYEEIEAWCKARIKQWRIADGADYVFPDTTVWAEDEDPIQ